MLRLICTIVRWLPPGFPGRARQCTRRNRFPHFVDDYLALPVRSLSFQRARWTASTPTTTSSRTSAAPAVDTHAGALAGFARRLDAIPGGRSAARRAGRAPDRRRQHSIAAVRGRGGALVGAEPALLRRDAGLEPCRPGDLRLRPGGPNAPAASCPSSGRYGGSLQAARENVKEPPAIFVKVGIDTLNGVVTFIDADLPRAFARCRRHAPARRPRRRFAARPSRRIGQYAQFLENEVRPKARASFRLGPRDASSRSCGSTRASPCPSRSCWRSPSASSPRPRRSSAPRRRSSRQRPARHLAQGQAAPPEARHRSSPPRASRCAELKTFLERSNVVSMPDDGEVGSERHPGLLPLVVRQHVDARPVRDARRARRSIT